MLISEWDDFIRTSVQGGDQKLALSIGVFDGVHLGHQALLERISAGSCPAVITFKQNPKRITSPEHCPGDIFSLKQKLAVLETLGVRRTVLIDFSGDFSKIKGRNFIDLLIKACAVDYLVLGKNFRCGYRLDTGAEDVRAMMLEAGIKTEVLAPVMESGQPVSSSRIRQAVSRGDLAGAARLLGRNLEIDLSEIPVQQKGEYESYDAVSASRIVPPDGTYRILLYGADLGAGNEAEITIDNGKILIPAVSGGNTFSAERVEFIPSSQ
jgi:riboflavin kinase/FMN adenylyltransferase